MNENYRVTIDVPNELYEQWRKYLLEKYGITQAGRYSKIREFNNDFFILCMKTEMEKK